MNEWSYTSVPAIRLNVKDGEQTWIFKIGKWFLHLFSENYFLQFAAKFVRVRISKHKNYAWRFVWM